MSVTIQFQNNGAYLKKDDAEKPIVLSGGFGQSVKEKMNKRGIRVDDPLRKGSNFIAPLDVPGIVEELHVEYAIAGADILTADTFCASVARQKGDAKLADTFAKAATDIARSASIKSGLNPLVATSLTTIGDTDLPNDVPDNDALIIEHKKNVEILKDRCDLVIAETLPNLREAKIIADILQYNKTPFLMTFNVTKDGTLRDGSNMKDVVQTILDPHSYCLGVGVNCCSVEGAKNAVSALSSEFNAQGQKYNGKHIAVYPNGFAKSLEENAACGQDGCSHELEKFSPDYHKDVLADMIKNNATIVGGCCGTTPAHTKVYSELKLEHTPV